MDTNLPPLREYFRNTHVVVAVNMADENAAQIAQDVPQARPKMPSKLAVGTFACVKKNGSPRRNPDESRRHYGGVSNERHGGTMDIYRTIA
jgi:hypothetical protein